MNAAVPTVGAKGVRFRSRLEARWAAFFTLIGWPWEYEPDLGLEGEGRWLPDFAIASGGGLLVEVKPVFSTEGFAQHRERIARSGVVAQVWLAGAALFYTKEDDPACGEHGFCGGWRNDDPAHWQWEPARFSRLKPLVSAVNPVDREVAQRLWVRAGNALQWRRPT